ncbi:MAG: hypothetical protein MZV70_68700 [Desulfobacterales bacterium]|nr:hypothetical protein [Desulfobacterales bacterium]
MCCSGAEVLGRHGIPHAGNFMSTEAIMATGAVDAMAVDVQCIMQALAEGVRVLRDQVFHHQPPVPRSKGAMHIEFHEHNAQECTDKIVEMAIDRFKNRPGKVAIPQRQATWASTASPTSTSTTCWAAPSAAPTRRSTTTSSTAASGASPGVVGCTNPRVKQDYVHVELVKELIKNDVLVVQTGCSQIALAKAGLMKPEAAVLAGDGSAGGLRDGGHAAGAAAWAPAWTTAAF